MPTTSRSLAMALTLAVFIAGPGSSQQEAGRPGVPTAASQCTNNLKQIGIAMHNQARATRSLAAGRHQVELCAAAHTGAGHVLFGDGSVRMAVGETLVPVEFRGCPSDMQDFGSATVRTRERADGATEVVLASGQHRGCSAIALLLPAVQTAREASSSREVDARRISPRTRTAFGEFWSGLPARERVALQTRLRSLEARATRGENVERELAPIMTQHPTLGALGEQLQREPLFFVAPGGGEEPATCIGYGYIDTDGKFVCIGVLMS